MFTGSISFTMRTYHCALRPPSKLTTGIAKNEMTL